MKFMIFDSGAVGITAATRTKKMKEPKDGRAGANH